MTVCYRLIPLLLLCACDEDGLPPARQDPLYSAQWHLKNTGQLGATAGVDINVEPVWQSGNEGRQVNINVTDDGVESTHQDLAANMLAGRSQNFLFPDNGRAADDPKGDNDQHGTAVAGLIAAARNQTGGRGVAPQARLSGNNLLSRFTTLNASRALLQAQDITSISNNSWGHSDKTGELTASNVLLDAAIDTGIGARQGLGIVYLFAAGNGARRGLAAAVPPYAPQSQRSGYDGYNNHPAVLSIGALAADGRPAPYSEPGANILLSAPSSGQDGLPRLYTTALTDSKNLNYQGQHYRHYQSGFGGTSGATPQVSGVVALMLNANPALSWRDVRWLLARTAVPLALADDVARERGPAAINSVYSHYAGYGRVNAAAAVAAARGFVSLPPQQQCQAHFAVDQAIADGSGQAREFVARFAGCAIRTVESVSLTIDAPDHVASELALTLQSPLGRDSVLATPHQCQNVDRSPRVNCLTPYQNWRFSSIRHLGEAFSDGPWQLSVSDSVSNNGEQRLASARLTVYGY